MLRVRAAIGGAGAGGLGDLEDQQNVEFVVQLPEFVRILLHYIYISLFI